MPNVKCAIRLSIFTGKGLQIWNTTYRPPPTSHRPQILGLIWFRDRLGDSKSSDHPPPPTAHLGDSDNLLPPSFQMNLNVFAHFFATSDLFLTPFRLFTASKSLWEISLPIILSILLGGSCDLVRSFVTIQLLLKKVNASYNSDCHVFLLSARKGVMKRSTTFPQRIRKLRTYLKSLAGTSRFLRTLNLPWRLSILSSPHLAKR